ncbi:hypothetical protein CcCBS67573_g07477 [Chytriomyces confervae]|uniref:Uncharacterized protein n=1 Tax=Chytriomyces confervae TaxID=246404 RepID=A0A507EWC3_9FUNG|nr:hypothetical protein HDU80_009538 [Chytriomyces hyalinus]TPX67468.1 hypothetical protein CcCBS67573_g07477 [Chytriomyces confervae]
MRTSIIALALASSAQATLLLDLAALGLAAKFGSKLLGGLHNKFDTVVNNQQQTVVNNQQTVVNNHQPQVIVNNQPPVVINNQPQVVVNNPPPVVINNPTPPVVVTNQPPVVVQQQQQPPVVINQGQTVFNSQTVGVTTIINSIPSTVLTQITQTVQLSQQVIIQIIYITSSVNIQVAGNLNVVIQTIANQIFSITQVTVQPIQIIKVAQILIQSQAISSTSQIYITFQTIARVQISGSGNQQVITAANGQIISVQQSSSSSSSVYSIDQRQLGPFMPTFNSGLGFPGYSGSGVAQSIITSPACKQVYGGYVRAANVNNTDAHEQVILIVSEIASRNATITTETLEQVGEQVTAIATAYDVPTRLVMKLAEGVVQTYQANNITNGTLFDAFDRVSRAHVQVNGTADEVQLDASATVGSSGSSVGAVASSAMAASMSFFAIVALVL